MGNRSNPAPDELMRSADGGEGGGIFSSPGTGPLNGAIPAGTTRYGQLIPVAGFPALCSFTGLGVFMRNNPSLSDILVEWFADAGATTLIGSMTVLGTAVGLRRMKQSEITGTLPVGTTTYVRMSMNAVGRIAYGPLVLFYFPYMGS